MKYGDFSSLVQLGVGLNVGTAILQLYGEIGVQPMIRVLTRIKDLAAENSAVKNKCGDRIATLEGEFEVFRIRLFNTVKNLTIAATAIAASLVAALLFISFCADCEIPLEWAIIFSAFSILPTPIILMILWKSASNALTPLKEKAITLEKEALESS